MSLCGQDTHLCRETPRFCGLQPPLLPTGWAHSGHPPMHLPALGAVPRRRGSCWPEPRPAELSCLLPVRSLSQGADPASLGALLRELNAISQVQVKGQVTGRSAWGRGDSCVHCNRFDPGSVFMVPQTPIELGDHCL